MTVDDAIRRQPLHNEVAERLRRMILNRELAPGERLNERLLSERFGISRTPLREAIKVLSSEGLVRLHVNRGAAVAEISREIAEDLFQVIGALEALAGELACARASEADIDEIRAMHYQMRVHHTRAELAEYFALNQRIHQKIVACAGNAELYNLYNNLSGRVRRARYIANYSRERWDQAVEEHEEILDALIRRDGPRLKEILCRHLENKAKVVKAMLDEDLESDSASVADS